MADVPHHFELELEIAGTPEQVWHALATAEGISAWMMPTRLEPREGGAVTFDMGPDAESTGRVTAYEPGARFAYEEDWATLVGHPGADVTPLATEFLVEARSGGTCVVRVVTSAFGTGADWENEFWEEMGNGWAPMLDNLRVYVERFPGQRVTPLVLTAPAGGTPEEAVVTVHAALGAPRPGDVVTVRDLTGRVERVVRRHFLVVVDQPLPALLSCFAYGTGEGTVVQLQIYAYGEAAPAYVAAERAGWQGWLDGVATAEGARA